VGRSWQEFRRISANPGVVQFTESLQEFAKTSGFSAVIRH
jgi:hypothetical protein